MRSSRLSTCGVGVKSMAAGYRGIVRRAMSTDTETSRLLDAFFPYRKLYETHRALPEDGVPRDELLAMLDDMAQREDELAEQGRMSGSVYHGVKEHFAFIAQAFQRFAHAN